MNSRDFGIFDPDHLLAEIQFLNQLLGHRTVAALTKRWQNIHLRTWGKCSAIPVFILL
jgi:hypothetical protein